MNTKRLTLFLFLALWLGACGTIISVENLEIRIPTRAAIPTISASPSIVPSLTSVPTVTATASPTAILSLSAVTTANVNFRIAPSTDNTPILVVLTGTRVTLVGRNSDASWLRTVLADGRQGWMFWQNLSISGNRFDLPVITVQATATPTIDPTPTQERPKSRISYNINGEAIPDRAYLTGHLQRLCPSTVLIMNNLSYAVELYNLLHEPCGTIVISRSWSVLEGDEWYYRSAQNFVDQWRREGHPEIVRYSSNEPSFGGLRPLSQFVAADILLMQLARGAGFTVAMGNFSVGYYQPEQINSGGFDAYLRALNQYGHFLAVHEYACCALPFGVGQWQVEALLDRTRVQPASWPLAQALPVRLWNGELPPYWYLRRADWFLLRADLLGIPRPRILVTEFAWDNLPNIKPYIEPLRQQFGLDRYFDDMRGVNTYPELWRWYWPQWTFAQAACEQLRWAESIYPPEYLGFDMFTWSLMWQQTDFSGRENPAMFELHRCLEAA